MNVIKIENLWKEYRLGVIGHGTLTHDLQAWWARVRGHEDPNSPVTSMLAGQTNQIEGDRFWALRGINLELEAGEILGVIGSNGAGKSTLLKILSRVTAPTRGTIKVKGRIASLLEVGTGFHPELTGRENIFLNGAILGMSKVDVKKRLEEIIDFSGVSQHIDTPVKRYSSGMYVRLAFAVAAHLDPEILVVDEVLAVGDAAFQKKCLSRMQDVSNEGRTVLFVSHNMSSMAKLCSKGILLKEGSVHHAGSIDDVIATYLDQAVVELSSRTQQHNKLISFTKTWFTDSRGETLSSVTRGEDWFINIECNAVEVIKEKTWFNLVISTANGIVIAGLSNIFTGYDFKNIKGRQLIVCKIKNLMLNDGIYFYKLEVLVDGVLQDRIECAGKIVVTGKKLHPKGKEVPQKFPLIVDHSWTQVEQK